ncbi:MAG: HigA family addiction module antitoxin [Lachnospiraceae bacterium]|nr:HigA family addiction module antitoxin [Lachnospiraceae bacterium]
MGISAYKLAQEIHVPTSRIQDILHDRRKITPDTSLRLAKYFGVSDIYFLDMQNDIDIRNMRQVMADELLSIQICKFA